MRAFSFQLSAFSVEDPYGAFDRRRRNRSAGSAQNFDDFSSRGPRSQRSLEMRRKLAPRSQRRQRRDDDQLALSKGQKGPRERFPVTLDQDPVGEIRVRARHVFHQRGIVGPVDGAAEPDASPPPFRERFGFFTKRLGQRRFAVQKRQCRDGAWESREEVGLEQGFPKKGRRNLGVKRPAKLRDERALDSPGRPGADPREGDDPPETNTRSPTLRARRPPRRPWPRRGSSPTDSSGRA